MFKSATFIPFVLALLCVFAWSGDIQSQENSPEAALSSLASDPNVAVGGTLEPTRIVKAKGWAWAHEVRVWLPSSYHATDRSYPTIWVTDNLMESMRASLLMGSAGVAPEVIVVAVGAPASSTPAEFQRRRTFDFIPAREEMGSQFAQVPDEAVGGAPGFLDFLVRQLRPKLEKEYRMDPADHALAGHSGGAQFALYTLFRRPDSFAKYLISSPAVYEPWLKMEEEWHADHEDLPARVFLSAGELEASHSLWAQAQVVSTVALLAERFAGRAYPSLQWKVRLFENQEHISVIPLAYTEGVRYLWPCDAATCFY